jgi:hypothetical protein
MYISIRQAVRDDAPAIAHLSAAFDDLRATSQHITAHLRILVWNFNCARSVPEGNPTGKVAAT